MPYVRLEESTQSSLTVMPTQTAGYYHESIPTAMDAIGNIGHNSSLFDPTFSKNESLFTPDQLAPYSAIVFLSNSDQVLTDSGEAALADWLTQGGSLVGLHAGTACLFNDTAFGTAMGEGDGAGIRSGGGRR